MTVRSRLFGESFVRLLAVSGVAAIALALFPAFAQGQENGEDVDFDPTAACPVDAPGGDFEDQGDIPDDHVNNVNCAAYFDIVLGFDDGDFRPAIPVRRDQMASYIARTLDAADVELPDASEGTDFEDVSNDNPHRDNIRRLEAAGITLGGALGLSEDEFGPALRTRRDQMTSFIVRGAEHGYGEDFDSSDQQFDDVPSGNAHFENVNFAGEVGIVQGFDEDTFGPERATRRDQTTAFVVRLLNFLTTPADVEITEQSAETAAVGESITATATVFSQFRDEVDDTDSDADTATLEGEDVTFSAEHAETTGVVVPPEDQTVETNEDGEASFSFTSAQTGTVTVTASIEGPNGNFAHGDGDSDSAEKEFELVEAAEGQYTGNVLFSSYDEGADDGELVIDGELVNPGHEGTHLFNFDSSDEFRLCPGNEPGDAFDEGTEMNCEALSATEFDAEADPGEGVDVDYGNSTFWLYGDGDDVPAPELACGDEVTQDVTLQQDLGPCPAAGLIVTGDDVTVDLNGHTIEGDPANRPNLEPAGPFNTKDQAGVWLRQASGVTVENGTVTGFDAGVAVMGGSGNTLQDLTAQDNVNYRVVTGEDADPAEETPDCLFGEGVVAFNTSDNTLANSTVAENGPLSGVALVGNSDSNTLTGNEIVDNDVVNVTQDDDPRNTVCGTGDEQGPMTRGRQVMDIGVRVEGPGADNNLVENNEVHRNALTGIALHGYVCDQADNNGNNEILGNTVTLTGQDTHEMDPVADGISALQQGPADVVCVAHSNTINDNVSTDNFRDGVFMGGRESENNTLNDNVVDDNARHGIALDGSNGGSINNTLHRNEGHGNGEFDGADFNTDCDNNDWQNSDFGTVNQPCVLGPEAPSGTIDGMVTETETANAVEGAEVTVTGGPSETTQTTTTDEEGSYEVVVEPGTYTVDVSAEGYEDPASQEVTVGEDESVAADFTLEPVPAASGETRTTPEDDRGSEGAQPSPSRL